MECRPKPSAVVSSALILLLVHVMAAAEPGTALKLEPAGTSTHIPPLLDCAPPAPAARSHNNFSAFRGNVLALLGALPAAAAQSGGAVGGDDRAFARAFCFGSVPGDDGCLECLSAAAQDVADGCHGGRHGAVWRAGCFLSYADTNASTPREDAWRGWFYDDTPTAASGQCMADRTAAECSRCLDESARLVPALKEARQLSRVHGDAVVVVGYSCYLRVPWSPPTPMWRECIDYAVGGFVLCMVLIIEIEGLKFCIRIAMRMRWPLRIMKVASKKEFKWMQLQSILGLIRLCMYILVLELACLTEENTSAERKL